MNPVWFDEPKVLFNPDRLLRFWPTPDMTAEERVNASTRFVIYATVITMTFRTNPRDYKVLLLAAMVMVAMWALYINGAVKGSGEPSGTENYQGGECRRPTRDNPMSNISVAEFGKPSPPPACSYPTVRKEVMDNLDNTIPFDASRSRSSLPEHQRNAASRQFVTMPVSTVPGAQTEFAEWCYGKKHAPICRSDQGMCSPDVRGAQLENFRGLGAAGDLR
jgi:hypothetical protein